MPFQQWQYCTRSCRGQNPGNHSWFCCSEKEKRGMHFYFPFSEDHEQVWPFLVFFSFSSVQFSRSVMSDSLRPHELQHTRPPCPSPTPGVHPNSCASSRWCHPTISSSRPLLLPPIPPSIRVFSNESTLCMRWPEYWSFSLSISPFKPRTGLL